ncbi:MAG: LysR substrate-binding domain-containing protein, partial [Pseudomonadota bacterium]
DLAHLARTRNFSQAAELSHISQPAFSRRIRAVEDWVGVALVDRSTHPVSLTPAGQQMMEAATQAIGRLETERKLLQDAESTPDRYTVTFGAQHSIGWRFFPAWLQGFEDSFGPIMSRLRADDLPNCVADLKDGRVDFVIAYASAYHPAISEMPGLESLRIGVDQLIPVSKRGEDGRPVFDLAAAVNAPLPFLRFGQNAPISEHLEPLLRAYDLHRRLSTVYENSMGGALRMRARDGAGIAWLPKSLVLPDLEAGHLTRTGDPAWHVDLEIRVHRLRARTNRLTRAIWSYLAIREPIAPGKTDRLPA